MEPFSFEPMTVGTILDRTFRIYFKNFFKIIGLVSLPLLIIGALFIGGTFLLSSNQIPETGTAILIFIYFLLMFLLGIVAVSVMTASVTVAVSKIFLGEPVTYKETWRIAVRRLPTLIWSVFIVCLMIYLGVIFCVVPGVYLYLLYALIVPVVVLENLDAAESRSRASSLARDNLLEIFLVLFVLWFIKGIISQGPALFAIFFESEIAIIIGVVIQALSGVVLYPLSMIGIILVYYNCRIKQDGFDLEMLAREVMGNTEEDSRFENLPGEL